MDQQQIEKLKASIELSQETDLLNKNFLEEAADLINAIITNRIYNNTKKINYKDLKFTDHFIGDKESVNRVVHQM